MKADAVYRPHMELLPIKEHNILRELADQHPPFFNALIETVSVIIQRNKKYTGSQRQRSLFANFELTADILGVSVEQVFKNWMAIKLARIILNDQDYPDESFKDSLRDLANYAILYRAYLSEKETPPAKSTVVPIDFSKIDLNRPSEPSF